MRSSKRAPWAAIAIFASACGGGTTAAPTPTPAPDPDLDGPYSYAELDDTMNVAATGDMGVPVHVAYPTGGPSAGPYPVVVVAHGLLLAASEYYGYVTRLASFGYVALTVDYPVSLTSVDNTTEAQDLLAGLDWVKANAVVGAKADTERVGMTGHSLGGKDALLAATMDPRVKAAILLDPVDGGGPSGCTPPTCVEVAPLLSTLRIPTGFLGETIDATSTTMACAPAADNYMTFYAKALSPSFAVTVLGANHVSFLDDVSSCGFACGFCNPAKAPNAQVVATARAYVAAFYERWLRGNTAYDAYLTGGTAEKRYVSTKQATLQTK